MKLLAVEEAIKTNSTVLLVQLKEANLICKTFSDQVTAGLYGNTLKIYQVAEKLRKRDINTENLTARSGLFEAYKQYLEAQ